MPQETALPISTTTSPPEPTVLLSSAPQLKQAPLVIDPAGVLAAVRSVQPSAKLGAIVLDLAAGTEALAIEPDRTFRSASLVKLLIAIDALTSGADDQLRQRIDTMLRLSDDHVASALWVRGGGGEIVKRTATQIGLTATYPPKMPGQWGDTLLTARDVARIYQFIMTGLPSGDRTFVVGSLAGAPRIANDGFDQYFGIPAGVAGPWAVKQGWSDSRADIVVHSTGLAGPDWRYVIVLLTEHPLGVAWKTATKSATAAALALGPLG